LPNANLELNSGGLRLATSTVSKNGSIIHILHVDDDQSILEFSFRLSLRLRNLNLNCDSRQLRGRLHKLSVIRFFYFYHSPLFCEVVCQFVLSAVLVDAWSQEIGYERCFQIVWWLAGYG